MHPDEGPKEQLKRQLPSRCLLRLWFAQSAVVGFVSRRLLTLLGLLPAAGSLVPDELA